MFWMLALRVDKWVRVASGLGLLLLLVAQEKVCPWLVNPPSRPEPSSAARSSPSQTDQTPKKRSPKKSLPHVLPDAPAPRWPAGWIQTTLRQTTGARDGVVSCGQRNPPTSRAGTSVLVGGDPHAWHRFLEPVEPAGPDQPLARLCLPVDPAVRICISPTGPPGS